MFMKQKQAHRGFRYLHDLPSKSRAGASVRTVILLNQQREAGLHPHYKNKILAGSNLE